MENNDLTESLIIRTYKQTDMDFIIKRHKELYEDEYGFSSEFGDYVEKYVLKFHDYHDENRENIWIVEKDGKQIGVIAIVSADEAAAQLRWFLIEPEMRGRGLGHKLVKTAIDFCREKNYKHILLWTVNILGAARNLYKAYGFTLTESVKNDSWSKDIIYEERWDLEL
jgi:GNAT superfamily N-acetyltransferase